MLVLQFQLTLASVAIDVVIIAKVYSQLLLNRLTKWSITHDKLIDNQYGFQKGKSTTECIFILHSLIYKSF